MSSGARVCFEQDKITFLPERRLGMDARRWFFSLLGLFFFLSFEAAKAFCVFTTIGMDFMMSTKVMACDTPMMFCSGLSSTRYRSMWEKIKKDSSAQTVPKQ